MKVIKRAIIVALAGIALASAPAMGQQLTGSAGEEFLEALRQSQGSKAFNLIESKGSTVANYRGQDGSAGLHIVMRTHNASWIAYLLENGADPNIADKDGDTPLILASRSGYGEGVAQMLLGRADVDKANRLGETALIVAVQQRHRAIVSTLLKLGANPDKRDHAGYSAREYAKRDSRSTEMLKLIETVKSQRRLIAPAKAR
jgi:ankyrin repeat protein